MSWERRPTPLTTTGIYRDTANWYHIVCKSESGAMYLYVNGSLVSSNTSTTANPYTSGAMNIGGNAPTPASNTCLDGYLAEFHWVQGTALGPESFGEFDLYTLEVVIIGVVGSCWGGLKWSIINVVPVFWSYFGSKILSSRLLDPPIIMPSILPQVVRGMG